VTRWPIYNHVIFDFDSTLSAIEGIDVLASNAGVGDEVSELTQLAMDGGIDLEAVYQKRLTTIRPNRGEIRALKEQYKKHLTEDAQEVIAALTWLGHEVYIVSGGLLDPIAEIGGSLGIPLENIEAVDIQYNELSGDWWLAQTDQFDSKQPYLKSDETGLKKTHGKAGVIRKLLAGKRGRRVLIGDGTSDLAASSAVDLFVGYTGTVRRERVAAFAPAILQCRSLAPIVVLSAGFGVRNSLACEKYQALMEKAFYLIDQGMLRFNDAELGHRFNQAYRKILEEEGTIFR